MARELSDVKLAAERIEATDGLELNTVERRGGLTMGEVGCLISHENVLESFLLSGAEFALVLEDDAKFSREIPWPDYLETLAHAMTNKKIDLLQLGYLENVPTSLLGRIHLSLHRARTRAMTRRIQLRGYEYVFVFREFLAGTHGYVVSRLGAGHLLMQLSKAEKPVDGLYQMVAQKRKIKVARLARSEINQQSRGHSISGIDSDVA